MKPLFSDVESGKLTPLKVDASQNPTQTKETKIFLRKSDSDRSLTRASDSRSEAAMLPGGLVAIHESVKPK